MPADTEATFKDLITAWNARQAEKAKAEREKNLAAPVIAPPTARHVEEKTGSAANLTEAAACPLSHSPLPDDKTPNHENGSEDNAIYAPKCLCLLSKYPFIDSSRAWLMQVCRN